MYGPSVNTHWSKNMLKFNCQSFLFMFRVFFIFVYPFLLLSTFVILHLKIEINYMFILQMAQFRNINFTCVSM